MSVVLYHHGSSVCAAKVRLVLSEKDVKWDGRYMDILQGAQYDPDYLKLNPKAVVPTLVHNDNVIIESSVICEYIEDVFDGPQLMPQDPVLRAHVRVWTKLVDEDVHPHVRPLTYVACHRHIIMQKGEQEIEHHINSDPSPKAQAQKRSWFAEGYDSPDVRNALCFFEKLLSRMDDTLAEGPWLVGVDYTLADAALTPFINRLDMLNLSYMWEQRPHLARWFEDVKARPSFAPAIFEYLPEDLRDNMLTSGKKAQPEFTRVLATC